MKGVGGVALENAGGRENVRAGRLRTWRPGKETEAQGKKVRRGGVLGCGVSASRGLGGLAIR